MAKSFDIILSINAKTQFVASCYNAVKSDSIDTHSVTLCCNDRVTQKRYCKGCGGESPKTIAVHQLDAVNSLVMPPYKRNTKRQLVPVAVDTVGAIAPQCYTGKSWTIRPSELSLTTYSHLVNTLSNYGLYVVDNDGIPYVIVCDDSGLILCQLRHINDTQSGFPPIVESTGELTIECQRVKPLSTRDKLVAMVQDQLGDDLAKQLIASVESTVGDE